MVTKKVIKNLEAAINRVCTDIKEKPGGVGSDKLDSLSKLVNSYSRLIERDKQKTIDPTMDGDPDYHRKLFAEKANMKGIVR